MRMQQFAEDERRQEAGGRRRMQPSLQRRGPVCMQREEGRGAYAYVREEADVQDAPSAE